MASLHYIGWLQTTSGKSYQEIPILKSMQDFIQPFPFFSKGAKALLECGADPLNVGKIGQSPAQVAQGSNARDVIKVLQVCFEAN